MKQKFFFCSSLKNLEHCRFNFYSFQYLLLSFIVSDPKLVAFLKTKKTAQEGKAGQKTETAEEKIPTTERKGKTSNPKQGKETNK
jgi:hypothetical protein